LTEDIIRRESPLFNLPRTAPPLIADVGGDELGEFLRQSKDFINAWQNAGLTGSYVEQAGKNHFSVINDLLDPGSALCDRLVSMTGA
jgi:arylformamidase